MTSAEPSITVVVRVLNEESYIGPTRDALFRARGYFGARSVADVEILVVDNGSQDRTSAVARAAKGDKLVLSTPTTSGAKSC